MNFQLKENSLDMGLKFTHCTRHLIKRHFNSSRWLCMTCTLASTADFRLLGKANCSAALPKVFKRDHKCTRTNVSEVIKVGIKLTWSVCTRGGHNVFATHMDSHWHLAKLAEVKIRY